MKKFFRALAVVLALTLVIGTIPASAAEVTITPMKSKQLYLGGTKGFKTEADGTKKMSTLKQKVSYWRLLGITKADAEALAVTATSDKEAVAKVDDKTMKVEGLKMGDANITLKAGDASYTIPVAVKKSAAKVIFGDDFAGVEESKDITINTEYVLSVPRYEEGVKMDTDQRTMTITDKDGKDVTATYATKVVDEKDPKLDTRTWKVKFTEGGAYTVKAWSFQSAKKYPGATAEKTITVNVKEPTPISIAQTASDTFQIKFDADIEKLGYYKDAHDWDDKGTDGKIANRVYYKVGGVVVPFSSVKSTTPKEDKLTVVMYGPFVAGETYYAEIAGQTLDFVAAGNKAKDVTAIAITKKTAVAGITSNIEYKLYNAAGVDITKTAQAPEDINGSVSFSTQSSDAFIGADNTIFFTKVGDKAEVKGTFTFYDPDDNYKANEVTTTETIVAVAEDATNFVRAIYSMGGGSVWAGKHDLPLGDDNTALFVKAYFKKGTDEFDRDQGTEIKYIEKELMVKVSDEHFAMVTRTGADKAGVYKIRPVNEGKTNLVVYYLTDDNREVVLTTLPISIVPERKPTRLTATAVNEFTGLPYLNTNANVGDAIDIKVSLYDQYGDRMGDYNIDVTDRADAAKDAKFGAIPAMATAFPANAGMTLAPWDDAVWTITNANFTQAVATEKTVAFNVKAGGVSTVVSFRVKDADDRATAKNIKDVVYATGNSLDTGLTASDVYDRDRNVKMSINKMNGSYFLGTQVFNLTTLDITAKKDVVDYVADGAIDFYKADGETPNATGCAYVAKISYNGSLIKVDPTVDPYAVDAAWYAANPILAADKENSNNFANTIYMNGAEVKAALGTPVEEVQGFESPNDTLIFDAVDTNITASKDAHNGSYEKLASGTYNVIFYKITDDTAATGANDHASKYEVLGSKGVTVKDSQVLPTFKQLSQTIECADTSTQAIVDASINEVYEWKWDGWRDVDPSKITYKVKFNADTVYVYYAIVTIDNAVVGKALPLYARDLNISASGYNIVVPVKELLKVK